MGQFASCFLCGVSLSGNTIPHGTVVVRPYPHRAGNKVKSTAVSGLIMYAFMVVMAVVRLGGMCVVIGTA